jgi:hypothetical protein
MTSLNAVRARFARNEGLPFTDVLTEARIGSALDEHQVEYRNRVFGPVTTIWGFLSQVLSDDPSCRDAVARVLAHRAANGLEACSPNAASYCNARARLPAGVLRTLARRTAQELQANAPAGWRWNGRSVYIADGSHVSMPDTPQNQAAYPQVYNQGPGLGFPLARVAVLLSLATGACHDLAVAAYAGKGTGETTLLRQMYDASGPATWSWPTPCSTTTSSPASCASAASSWWRGCRRSGWGAGRWRPGPTATSSSGGGRTSRAG